MNTKKMHERRLHAALLLAELICVSAFALELSRALSGNVLSWAYVVEWPVLGAYAAYMWHRLLRDDTTPGRDAPPSTTHEDHRLAAYNKYLAQVHLRDVRDPDQDIK